MKIMVRMCVPWSMITVFQTVFQNGGCNLYRPVTCRLHQMPVAAMPDAATAEVMASAETGMSFPGQAA